MVAISVTRSRRGFAIRRIRRRQAAAAADAAAAAAAAAALLLVPPWPVTKLNVLTSVTCENVGEGETRTYRRSAEITALLLKFAPSGSVVMTGR